MTVMGFTCGAFDLCHAGHLLLLEEAKRNCDILTVGLHSDPSKERPEKNAPIESVYERTIRLYSCRYVDRVIVYETEADLVSLLSQLRPDIRFVGDDYKGKNLTGEQYCGKVFYHTRSNHDYSGSALRARMTPKRRGIFG